MLRDEKKVKPGMSPVKQAILKTIEEVDKKNSGYTHFFNAALQGPAKNTQLFFLAQMDLPDLIYLQYLIVEFDKPEHKDNIYKNAIIKVAEKNKKSLLVPLMNQSQQACFGVFLGGMLLRMPLVCLIASGVFLLSDSIAEWRLARQLETELALKLNQGRIAKLDEYDGPISVLAKFGKNGLHAIEEGLKFLPNFSK